MFLIYLEIVLSEDISDGLDLAFISFLLNQKCHIIPDLEKKGVVLKPTQREEKAMVDEYNKLRRQCLDARDKKFREKFGAENLIPIDEMFEKSNLYEDIIDALPQEMKNTPEFESLENSLMNEILHKYKLSRSSVKKNLPRHNKHVQYTIPTCPGSSGAMILGWEVRGTEVKQIHAIHRGAEGMYNFAATGTSLAV